MKKLLQFSESPSNRDKRRKSSQKTGENYRADRFSVIASSVILVIGSGFTLLCEIIFVMIPDLFLNFDLFGLKQYELVW